MSVKNIYLKKGLILAIICNMWLYAAPSRNQSGTASIGDYVWLDKNANGIQDNGEEGIENVKVHLYKDGNDTGKSTLTDSNGKYLFNNLEAGNYQIKVEPTDTYPYFSPQNQGNDDSKDSDIDTNSGLSDEVTLSNGDYCDNVDAGLNCGCSSISVQKSTNGEDADEGMGPLIEVGANVTWSYVVKNTGSLKLSDIVVKDDKEGTICQGFSLAAGESKKCTKTSTAKDGQYENLATVEGVNTKGNTVKDKDPSHYYGYKGACIGDYVWFDANNNGIQDNNESGLKNVQVELSDANGNIVKNIDGNKVNPVNTNSKGEYIFCNLKAGKYVVKVTPPSDYSVSPKNQGTDNTEDSDIDPTTHKTDVITVNDGDIESNWDAGLYKYSSCISIQKSTNGEDADEGTGPLVTVGSTITWKYVVKNGGDVKLNNVIVKDNIEGPICSGFSLEAGETKVCTKTGTATEGQYENIATVEATNTKGDKVTDSDPSHYYGKELSCLGDFIWLDKNANGIQDSGELGVKGVKVELLDENGNQAKDFYGNSVAPYITGSNGKYSFCKLDAGKYIIKITPPNGYVISPKDQGNNDEKDSDIDSNTSKSQVITLSSSSNDMTWDAGLYKPACIGDLVWLDYNGNGIQDNNSKEVGIDGAVVTLMDSQGDSVKDINGKLVTPQTTGNDGKYMFCNLKPGTYKVKMVKDDSLYYVTFKHRGDSRAKDSDINQDNYTTDPITITSGEIYKDLDGGYFKCGSLIGIYSVLDNNIGSKTPRVLANLKVTIYNENGDVADVVKTDNNGKFSVGKLLPGKYKLVFQKPDGMKFAKDKNIYITVKPGDKNIKVENIVAPENMSDDDVKKALKNNDNRAGASDTKKSFMSALTPAAMFIMIFSIFTLVRSRD